MPAARKSGRTAASVLGLALVILVWVPVPGAAAAPPETCPNPRPGDVEVQLSLPEAGATVSGLVQVDGSVTASEPVFQVELFVGEARRDVVVFEPPVAEASFTLRWDATSRAPGPATIEVVACGGTPAEGSLIRGQGAVDVVVEASAAGARTGGTLSQPVGSKDEEWAPAWVGLTFGAAGLVGLAYALVRTSADRT